MMQSWTRWEGRGSADSPRKSSKQDRTMTTHRLLLLPSQPGAGERVREYFRLSGPRGVCYDSALLLLGESSRKQYVNGRAWPWASTALFTKTGGQLATFADPDAPSPMVPVFSCPMLRSRQRWRVQNVTEGSVAAESLCDSHSPGTEFLVVTLVV